jgi:anaerobic magnesium-protoporphyrin IX monomethyl ester cyclase
MRAEGGAGAPAVLLVSVQADVDVIGLKYLHATLRRAGYRSHLLFLPGGLRGHDTRAAVAEFARQVRPLFVGVSVMAVEEEAARAVSDLLRATLGVPIVWGGIHPTVAPADCLSHADLVCRGEGERTVVELAAALRAGRDPRALANLAYLGADGAVVLNPLHPLAEDLDALPAIEHLPENSFVLDGAAVVPLDRRRLRRFSRYRGAVLSVITSRGCPFGCAYCCNERLAALYGRRRVRRRDSEKVIDEIVAELRAHPAIAFVHFHDDSFLTGRAGAIDQFCRSYETRVGRPFFAKGIPTEIRPATLAALRAAGIAWLNVGLQSGSDRISQEIYERHSTRADFLRAAALIKEARIAPWYDVILDNPFETDRDRAATIETLARTPGPFYPKFFSLTFYPGTKLHARAIAQGLPVADARRKDYAVYQPTRLNALTRLAAFLPPSWTEWLLERHLKGADGLGFEVAFWAARLLSGAVIEPVTYWRLALLSRQGAVWPALASLPVYAADGLSRYLQQLAREG